MEKHKQDSEVKMTIRFEENVSTENAQLVCRWSNSLGKSFQEQWMGTMIPFPLTIQILQDLEGIFSIFDGQEFVGLIQKIRLEDSNLHIGRFFINPQKQGQGLGSQAVRKFVSLAFEKGDIDSISLNVYEANQAAKHLYQKEGFEIVQTIEAPVRKYVMKKFR
ncbi:Acetyltransferase (GNAT) family protein [Streptococcus mitis]|uniref:Acetyltransferase (GNAT) family protein n=2 Tax=Streptococcus mitis TaxID=28037 RepID=A0A428DBM9_STRMT|nr:Acetyltransferase (GNAT) family protein [Streptococcus mitis]